MSEKSYKDRGRSPPQNHAVYDAFIKRLQLKLDDFNSMNKRGLTGEQIAKAGYVTKPTLNSKDMADALSYVVNNFNPEGVPGFYINDKDGGWTCATVYGIVIPCRDLDGNISSLLIRNANSKTDPKTGKPLNKYVQFSSAGKLKGTRTYQRVHCPVVTGPAKEVCGVEIRITEGVLKADISTALSGMYTIGLQGLNVGSDLEGVLEELEVAKVFIALDQGEDENIDMIRNRAKLIKELHRIGVDVEVEKWDFKYGKGIDDIYHSGNSDKITLATPEEIEAYLEQANTKDPENGDYLYVVDQEKFFNIHNFKSWKKSQFCDRFGLEKIDNINKMLALGYKQVDGLIYKPGADKIIRVDGYECLNIWRDPAIIPVEGEVKMFLDHMEHLFPVEENPEHGQQQIDIILDFLAYIVQNPGVKMKWMILIQGDEGVGKSFIGETMKVILGPYNVSSPTMEILLEKYTDWAKSCQLVIIEEMLGDDRRETMNKLKPIIVQDTIMIREMHMRAYEQPNFFNLIAYTNYDDAIKLTDKDRRYGILKTLAEKKDKEYYDALFDWIKQPENIAAVLQYLLSRDLSKFNPSHAPMTAAKKDLINISISNFEAWVMECVEDCVWPFEREIVSVRHLKALKDLPPGFNKISDYKYAEALRKAGCKQAVKVKVKKDNGKFEQVRPWIVRPNSIAGNLDHADLARLINAGSLEVEPGGSEDNFLEFTKPM